MAEMGVSVVKYAVGIGAAMPMVWVIRSNSVGGDGEAGTLPGPVLFPGACGRVVGRSQAV